MKQGLYGWMNKNLRGRKGQQGFTLIELLVVVTILGILAAIVTLSLVGLTTNASIQSCNQEYKTVQAALDAYMANNNLNNVPESTGTSNMSSPVPLYNAKPPTYIRNTPTQWAYAWNTSGQITAIIQRDATSPSVPDGCKVSG